MTIERADVQGLVASGYARMHRAGFFLLAVREPGAARAWLAELAARVTTSERPEEERCLNVAFTREGLAALGAQEADLASFPVPFQEGMASLRRARLLSDTRASAPDHWEWGGPATEAVHLLLLVYARDAATFDRVEAEELAALTDGGALEVVRRLDPEDLPGRQSVGKFGVEHFGFADGMSQPVVRGFGQEHKLAGDDARRSVVEAGEIVLGYPNAYGKLTPWPRVRSSPGGSDFGRNGTYVVFRQLHQDVAGFRRFLEQSTLGSDGAPRAEERDRLGARFVGRWPSGAPLVKAPSVDDPTLGADNSFGYAAADPYGLSCPVGSHIRRSNPRDSLDLDDPASALELANLHRILRRGRVYGPGLDEGILDDDGRERGLLFICLNANLERQFEFVQHHWCNNPKFAGLYDETDPILADQPDEGGRFTIQAEPVRRRIHGIPSFVTVRGGAYLFLPGVRALRHLAALGG